MIHNVWRDIRPSISLLRQDDRWKRPWHTQSARSPSKLPSDTLDATSLSTFIAYPQRPSAVSTCHFAAIDPRLFTCHSWHQTASIIPRSSLATSLESYAARGHILYALHVHPRISRLEGYFFPVGRGGKMAAPDRETSSELANFWLSSIWSSDRDRRRLRFRLLTVPTAFVFYNLILCIFVEYSRTELV